MPEWGISDRPKCFTLVPWFSSTGLALIKGGFCAINSTSATMSVAGKLFSSSLGKKYLMAVSGLVWVGFVFGHMAGNLQVFLPPAYINAYAHKLQSLGPALWGIRAFLLLALVVHVWMAIKLTAENRAARPSGYKAEDTVQASLASRTMIYSGLVILAFFIFHILHYTVRNIYDYNAILGHSFTLEGVAHPVMDVYAMMYLGFSHWYVSLFYLVAVGLLLMHLTHGVSSMFQSIGLRNEYWRGVLGKVAVAYGWLVFLGFAAIPVAVMADYYGGVQIFDHGHLAPILEATKIAAK